MAKGANARDRNDPGAKPTEGHERPAETGTQRVNRAVAVSRRGQRWRRLKSASLPHTARANTSVAQALAGSSAGAVALRDPDGLAGIRIRHDSTAAAAGCAEHEAAMEAYLAATAEGRCSLASAGSRR